MHIFVFLHRFLENEIFRIPQPARAALILQKLISSKNLKVSQKTAIYQGLLKERDPVATGSFLY